MNEIFTYADKHLHSLIMGERKPHHYYGLNTSEWPTQPYAVYEDKILLLFDWLCEMWGVAEAQSPSGNTQALLITASNNTEDTNLCFCGQLYHRLPELQLRVRIPHFSWYDRL